LGKKTRDNNGESHKLRTSGDVVSLQGANAKHMTSLDNWNYLSQGIIGDVLSAHDVGQIKNSIYCLGSLFWYSSDTIGVNHNFKI
jgi:hypothetical protein